MICYKCNFDNTDDSKFCIKCGSKIAQPCSGCGRLVSINIKFCPWCGTGLRQVLPETDKTIEKELEAEITPEEEPFAEDQAEANMDAEDFEAEVSPVEDFAEDQTETEADMDAENEFEAEVKPEDIISAPAQGVSKKKKNAAGKPVVFHKPKNRIFVYREGDYAYAECVEVTEKAFKFRCIDYYSYFSLQKKLCITLI